jgi:hypothetical protein
MEAYTKDVNKVEENELKVFDNFKNSQTSEELCSLKNMQIVNNISGITEIQSFVCDDNYDIGF